MNVKTAKIAQKTYTNMRKGDTHCEKGGEWGNIQQMRTNCATQAQRTAMNHASHWSFPNAQ